MTCSAHVSFGWMMLLRERFAKLKTKNNQKIKTL